MKTYVLAATACAATLFLVPVPSGALQGAPSGSESSGLVRVPPAGRADFDGPLWAGRLTDLDLDRREEWFARLVERARSAEEVRAWLREQATGDPTLELTWTARLALREAERAGTAAAPGIDSMPGLPGIQWQSFPGQAIPGQAIPGQAIPGQGFEAWDLDSWLEDMQRRFGVGLDGGGLGGPQGGWQIPVPFAGGPGAHQQQQSFSMEQGPDGVRIEVRELVDGEEQVRTYEGDTLDELLEANPELRERIAVRGGGLPSQLRFHWAPGSAGSPGQGGARPWWGAQVAPDAPAEIRTDVLGVYPRKLSDDEALRLGLQAGSGLVVERVEPFTIAHALGLAAGDVVLEINGASIGRIEDVSAALAARPAGGEVTVGWLDGFGRRRSATWRPAAPAGNGPDADGAAPDDADARDV